MSTDKTSLSHIRLVIALLALCTACAPNPDPRNLAGGAMAVPKPKQIEIIVPEPAEPVAEEVVEEEEVAAQPEEETTIPEAEQTITEEVKELANLDNDWQEGKAADEKEILYDFPITVNLQVEYYLDFFQNRRSTFARWLAQAGRYLPMIEEKLADAGLPRDLAFLPMIESGYNLTACSSAGAAGPWQFMKATAHNLGLKVDEDVDERRDPFKSTDAAIKYLNALYNEFGSWYLAVAAYNAGEGRVRQAISNKGTDNFWQLAQGNTLNIETKRYVPKLIAAIMIARNPGKYGFDDVIPEPPLAYDEIKTPPRTALKAVAVAGDIPIEQLRDLNRQLLRGTTPNQKGYIIRVPVGKSDLVAQNFSRVRASVATEFRTHVVSGRDTLGKIARRYNLTKTILRKANNLRGNGVKAGQRLQIPCQTMTYSLASAHETADQQKAAALNTDNLVLHRIRKGETLSQIADRYNVTTRQIADWNDLKSLNDIRAGQKLALYLDDAARRNAKQARTESQQLTYYMVQGGDTLWNIAKRFNLAVEEIRRLNKLADDIIKPGVRLIIKESDLDA